MWARLTAAIRIVGRAARSRKAVRVAIVIRHRSARCTVLHVVDQVFLIRESVDAILVLDVTSRCFDGHAVNAVTIVIQQLVEAAVRWPSPERTSHKHFVEIRACTAHVHVERGVEQARVVIQSRVSVVVVRRSVRTTQHILFVRASLTAAVSVVGGAARSRKAVRVAIVIRHRSARCTVLHVVDQVFLIRESVDAILVLDVTSRCFDGHAVNAVTIVIQQLVEAAVRWPSPERTSHKHFVEIRACTAHVHVEGGVEQAGAVIARCLYVIVVR